MTRSLHRHIRTAVLAAAGGLFLFTGAPAHAMPPAHGLDGAEERAAERLLDAAHDRGVGELPASPFLRATSCGRATKVLRSRVAQQRAASQALRTALRRGSGVGAARRALRARTAAVATARRAHARACAPTTNRSLRDEEFGTLDATTTAQRPQSTLAGRGMVIALPVDFSDRVARRSTNTPSRYDRMLFDAAYPFGGGSLASFWRDMSFGSFTVAGDVASWKRVPGRRGSYAADTGGMGAYPANSQSLLEDAVAVNDASVDFARYDNDGPDGRANSGDDDGFVDAVFLIYAGTSAAENGNLDTMWPHAWRHTVATRDASANGGVVRVGRYAALPERMEQSGPDGDLLTVGVAAHEYGHVLGLPDLVDGERGDGAGQWDLMGSGMWGFEHSSRPTGLSAWSRARLGWLTPQLLEGDHLGYRLGASYAQRTAVKLPIEGEPLNEHFLVERRTTTGFDADAPGDGLLVWHVDDSIAADDASGHPRVELVAADGGGNGDAGDLLTFGRHLSDSSSPGTRAHDGGDSHVLIQNVQDAAVDLHAGRASLAPAIDTAIDGAGPQAAVPTATLTAPVAGAFVRGTITMSCNGAGNPNLNRITFYRNSTTALSNVTVTPTAPTSTKTFAFDTTTRPDGPNVLACRARNTSNQWSAYSNAAVTLDNTAPAVPTISAPAAAPAWLRGTVTWTASGTDTYLVRRFSYRVDGVDNWQGPYAPASPQTQNYSWNTTLVTNGAHALTVRSEDQAGNQSAVSATRTVNVDNLAPSHGAPADGVAADVDQQTDTTTLDANWTAATDGHSGVASYQWRFCTAACGSVVASGSGAATFANATGLSLADGTYYACLRTTDVAGNQSAEQCSDGVFVDGTAPIVSAPLDGTAADIDGQVSTSVLDANWAAATDGTGSGVVSYDWRFCDAPACGTVLASGSGAGLTAGATGLTLTGGSTYQACVRATDGHGNVSGWQCSDGVTIDAAAPVVSAPLDGTAADVDFQTSTSVLDANWAAATDASGVAGYDWQFCDTPACGAILATGSGAGLTAGATGLSLTNGSSYVACLRATDTLGNVSGWTCSDAVVVDSTPPTMGVPSDGAAADIDTQGSLSSLAANWAAANDGAGSGVASYAWRFCTTPACGTVVASGSGAGTTASATGLTLTNGATYYTCVSATDGLGQSSADSCSDGVVASDVTAPTTSHGGVVSGSTVGGLISLTSNSADAGGLDRVEYRIDAVTRATAPAGGATTFNDAGTPFNTATLLDGNHGYRIATYDLAGNVALSTPSTQFIINNTVEGNLPGGTLTSPGAGALAPTNVTLTTNATDDNVIVLVEFLIDGGLIPGVAPIQPPAGTSAGPFTRTWTNTGGVSAGAHMLSARITDASGNVFTTPGVAVTK